MISLMFFCSLKSSLEKEELMNSIQELKNTVEDILNTPDLSIYLK